MATTLPDAKALEGKKEQPESPPQSRDFFFDVVVLYVVASILTLAAIDAVSEYIRGSDIQCYWPNETSSDLLSNVGGFVNEYCTRYIPTLQLLPTVVVIHAIALLIPHYTWFNAYGAELDFFFIHVWKMERYREKESGDYPAQNYIIAKQLKEAFNRGHSGMYWWYIAKIAFQLFLCLLGLFVVPTLLFKIDEQSVTFQCPKSENEARGDDWPLPDRETVVCIFSPLNLLQKLWIVYLFLLALGAFLMVINLIQLVMWHKKELGVDSYAKFSFETGLSHHYFHPSAWRSFRRNSFSLLYPYFPYSIKTDYDFLMVRLFRTDCGLAYIMKEVSIGVALQDLNNEERTKLHHFRQIIPTSEEFSVAGWKVKRFPDRPDHRPALMKSVLIMRRNIRGIVMGLALRCEGDYFNFQVGWVQRAKQCYNRSKEQYFLAEDLLEESQNSDDKKLEEHKTTALKLLEQAKNYIDGARDLYLRFNMEKIEMDLKSREQELSTTMLKMEQMIKLESDMKESLGKVRARGCLAKAQVLAKDLDKNKLMRSTEELSAAIAIMELMLIQHDEKFISAKDIVKTAKNKVKAEKVRESELESVQKELDTAIGLLMDVLKSDIEQYGGLRLFKNLSDTASKISKLQEEIISLEEDLKSAAKDKRTYENNVSAMKRDRNNLIKKQIELARTQEEDAENLENPELQQRALSCLGPSLLSALVIGFDMEPGLPFALARIFKRVGFINFSSYYGDYHNPVKIVSESFHLFSVTVPADIFACNAPCANSDNKDGQSKSPTDKLMIAMSQIWRPDFQHTGTGGDSMKTSYVVIGPIKDDVQKATVNRVLDICHTKSMILTNALLVTVKFSGIAGTFRTTNHHLSSHYGDKALPCKIKLVDEEDKDWDKASTFVATKSEKDAGEEPPYRMTVEDVDVSLIVKLYRKQIPPKDTPRQRNVTTCLSPQLPDTK